MAASISGYKEVIEVAYDLSAIGQVLDFMSVMTYDYHGAWERKTGHVSPLYSTAGEKYPQYTTVSLPLSFYYFTTEPFSFRTTQWNIWSREVHQEKNY